MVPPDPPDIPDSLPDDWGRSRKGPRRTSGKQPEFKLPPRAAIVTGVLVAFLLVVVVMALTGRLGVVTVGTEQVAVKVNYLTGDKRVVTQPGYQVYLPFVQDVFVLDKRVLNFEMRGDGFSGLMVVPKLTVRANDGSNFRFEALEIQYSLIPSMADTVLADSGAGDGFKREWIKAHTRSILRDEFGRYSTEEIAHPGTLQVAFTAGKDRLNAELEQYGLHVIEMPQQRPNFDEEYEFAIEDRKVTDQSVERLIAMEDQLLREREQRLAVVEREKKVEMEALIGELERLRLASEQEAIREQLAADAYAVDRVATGQAEKAQLTAEARGLTARYTKEAEGVRARADALAASGEVIVREALIQKLAQIRFTFVPYSRDPAPNRLEHIDRTGAREAGLTDGERAATQGDN